MIPSIYFYQSSYRSHVCDFQESMITSNNNRHLSSFNTLGFENFYHSYTHDSYECEQNHSVTYV